MRIAFFTEMGFTGKIVEHHPNMRTEFAWMYALDAEHVPLSVYYLPGQIPDEKYDLGIIIFPKQIPGKLRSIAIVEVLKKYCTKVAFMQEGPSWYYQDLPVGESLWFLAQMDACDFVLAHNPVDQTYYRGLLSKECYINPTLMIETTIKGLNSEKDRQQRKSTIVGGNLVRWYGGHDSVLVAKNVNHADEVWLPKMGRMQSDELYIQGLNHLPYLVWTDWMKKLNEFKYAVHLNPNTIGGTFNLNCAYLGIPCIGNKDTHTQNVCFPELSIDVRDIGKAKQLYSRLIDDVDFYSECSSKAVENYHKYFSIEEYLKHWKNILDSEF